MSKIGFILSICLLFLIGCSSSENKALYQNAIVSASDVQSLPSYPLIALTPDNPQVEWKDGKVALVTWHNRPDIYKGVFKSRPFVVWTVGFKELKDKLKTQKECSVKRLEQLFGLPPDTSYEYLSVVWVSPLSLWRPAYNVAVNTDNVSLTFDANASLTYISWFKVQERKSYDMVFGRPWTRKGYTYDWGQGDSHYGLSEYVIRQGAFVEVKETLEVDDFLDKYCP